MPRYLPRFFASARRRLKPCPVAEFQRQIHAADIIAVVVFDAERIFVRQFLFGHEIAPAQRDAIVAAFARGEIDQPLHDEDHLGPAGAAIGPRRRGVAQAWRGRGNAPPASGRCSTSSARPFAPWRNWWCGRRDCRDWSRASPGTCPCRRAPARLRRRDRAPDSRSGTTSWRSMIHFTGRPSFFAAQATSANSA